MTDTIDDRLNKVLKDVDEMLGISENAETENPKSNIDRLIRFGFTVDEAKAFLEHEPNFTRRKVTEEKSDGDVPAP